MHTSHTSRVSPHLKLATETVDEDGRTMNCSTKPGRPCQPRIFQFKVVPLAKDRSIPSGKLSHNYGKSPCYSWENSLSMVIFHSYVNVYQRVMVYDG